MPSQIPGYTRRAPATPLVVHDPSFSLWSFRDHLNDGAPQHWTGYHRGARALVRIDGEVYRLLGEGQPPGHRPLPQTGCEVFPTRTRFTFAGAGVEVTLTFLSPLLPDDLDVFSRPLTYVETAVASTDGAVHEVEVYHEWGAEAATNTLEQPVVFQEGRAGNLRVLKAGTASQNVLGTVGDNLRCDWGYFHLVVEDSPGTEAAVTGRSSHLVRFAATGSLAGQDPVVALETNGRALNQVWPRLAVCRSLGKVGLEAQAFVYQLAWEDGLCLEYLNERLVPYWQRDGKSFYTLVQEAASQFTDLKARCEAFDQTLLRQCQAAGGPEYRDLCALAYRQAIGAHKLAQTRSGLLCYFSKENFSNGCIATVDVTYPSAPLFLLTNPKLLEAMVAPLLAYAQSPRWKFPFAPHDLGTYPLANGQVYGGGEASEGDQMPVEESGNLLLLVAALEAVTDRTLVEQHWDLLAGWARYLADKGLDPENQLCTDDFAGHLAHNANLSLKAILAVGAFAGLAGKTGRADVQREFRTKAEAMAAQWLVMADDGDHTRLVFDQPGTWSQKYNLVWDRLLGLGLFPESLARKEVAFYKKQLRPYGLPLDQRSEYTKLDWSLWSACLAPDEADFLALTAPLSKWAAETRTRVPLSDWYWTTTGDQVGFQARSVVGGLFLRALQSKLQAD